MTKKNFRISEDKLSLIFQDGAKTTFRFPVADIVDYPTIVVVRLDVPPKGNENENVFGVDYKGQLLWQVPEKPHVYEDSPYTGMHRAMERVVLTNWDGLELTVIPQTGEVVGETYRK